MVLLSYYSIFKCNKDARCCEMAAARQSLVSDKSSNMNDEKVTNHTQSRKDPPKYEDNSMAKLQLHPYYVLFFLYVEPISAIVGAIAGLFPEVYLALLQFPPLAPAASSTIKRPPASPAVSATTATCVTQLANLYLYFALTEALVLRAGRHQLPVWRALAFTMLVADFGHLASGFGFDSSPFWDVAAWGPMQYGGIGFVYAGAATRTLFLLGVGVKLVEKRD
jgi:hypothetical protein